MGRKIFISYKYADTNVKSLTNDYWNPTKVRDYVDTIEDKIDSSNHIYKAESDGEDLSYLSDVQIWNRLKNRIYDSTITIVMISKGMKESYKAERLQWIPREISYSLKEISRIDSNGNPITSRSNGLLGVVIPDQYGSYDYILENKTCCSEGCRMHHYDYIFNIMENNLFNEKSPNRKYCNSGSYTYYGDYSYMKLVKWDDFISNMTYYVESANSLREKQNDYNLCKEV